jgi:hypothetical protein
MKLAGAGAGVGSESVYSEVWIRPDPYQNVTESATLVETMPIHNTANGYKQLPVT